MASSGARSFKQAGFGVVCSLTKDAVVVAQCESLEAEMSMARWDVKQFCDDGSATSVHPSAEELVKMWCRCAKYHPSAVVAAIHEQLAAGWSGGEKDWQPQLRALLLLEHMKRQPGAAGGAARAAALEWKQLLLFLIAEVPQFKDVAGQLLDLPRFITAAVQQMPSQEAVKVHRAVADHAPEDDIDSATSTEVGRLSSLSDVECDCELEQEEPLPAIPHAPGLETRADPQKHLWLASAECVPMERLPLPDPFAKIVDTTAEFSPL